jgi:hypothetical protein
MIEASPGKTERLDYLCRLLGLESCPGEIHYQLLHRSVSALVEAERFAANRAAMIVHSFSPERRWYDAFADFVRLLGVEPSPDEASVVSVPGGSLLLGWACGDQKYRAM